MSLFVCQRPADGVCPSLLGLFDVFAVGYWLEGTLYLPLALYLVDVFPEAYCQTCQIGSTERGGLSNLRTDYLYAEQVG